MVNFGQGYARVNNQLFKQYCCSYHGAPLWKMQSYESICVACRREKHITQSRVITLLSGSAPLPSQLKEIFLICFFFFFFFLHFFNISIIKALFFLSFFLLF